MNIEELINEALLEDIGDGDHTSLSTIPENSVGKARLLIKEDGVLAGVNIARQVFEKVDKNLKMEILINDGSHVKKGDVAFYIEGSSRSVLTAERLVLNFMQRLSGIATHTRRLVDKLDGLSTIVLDTRKTTPNLRQLEKYAVVIGGGQNHRMGLYDMVMIKDNHVDFAGGINQAIEKCHVYLSEKKKNLKIEIEVRSFKELNEVIECGKVDRIMLDNFSVDDMKEAVQIINGRFETEASGGITEETIRKYAETGVDYVSVGALTHHISSLDMSLKAVL